MRQLIEPELLDAMKIACQGIENVKLLSPDDLDIIDPKKTPSPKIAEMQAEDSDGNKKAA
jgi:hypothetical protein